MAGAYSYEQAFTIMRQLRLPKSDAIQQYRRMLFNVLARNQDDHTKNIAFLMNRHGDWSLSPAYDVTYAADPANQWLSRHQMTINGKRDGFRVRDLVTVGESIGVKKPGELIDEIREVVSRWPDYAAEARLPADDTRKIAKAHRLGIA
jgi:serine/threonine-protein kinase HipA